MLWLKFSVMHFERIVSLKAITAKDIDEGSAKLLFRDNPSGCPTLS